eukprot:3509445-Rhodomonas_salina.1
MQKQIKRPHISKCHQAYQSISKHANAAKCRRRPRPRTEAEEDGARGGAGRAYTAAGSGGAEAGTLGARLAAEAA